MIKVMQYIGPFSEGETIEIRSVVGYSYVHIGLQIPCRQPIARQIGKNAKTKEETKKGTTYLTALEDCREEGWTSYEKLDGKGIPSADLEINGVQYRVSSNDILEFTDITVSSWSITFLKDLPWGTIIDIMYSELDLS